LPIAAKAWTGKRYSKTSKSITEIEIPAAQIAAEPLPTIADAEDKNAHEDEDVQVPLAGLIGERLIDGKVRCPFHPDNTPSLSTSTRTTFTVRL
jgi:hypothetical protein